MDLPINETSNQSGASLVVLEGSDEVSRLLPTGHGSSTNAPQSDCLVIAATCNAELLRDVKDGARDEVGVSQNLNGSLVVQVPYNNFLFSSCQQIIFIRILWIPANVNYVKIMFFFELFEGLNALVWFSIEQSSCEPFVIVDSRHLVDPKNAILSSSRQILSILSKLNHPDG